MCKPKKHRCGVINVEECETTDTSCIPKTNAKKRRLAQLVDAAMLRFFLPHESWMVWPLVAPYPKSNANVIQTYLTCYQNTPTFFCFLLSDALHSNTASKNKLSPLLAVARCPSLVSVTPPPWRFERWAAVVSVGTGDPANRQDSEKNNNNRETTTTTTMLQSFMLFLLLMSVCRQQDACLH